MVQAIIDVFNFIRYDFIVPIIDKKTGLYIHYPPQEERFFVEEKVPIVTTNEDTITKKETQSNFIEKIHTKKIGVQKNAATDTCVKTDYGCIDNVCIIDIPIIDTCVKTDHGCINGVCTIITNTLSNPTKLENNLTSNLPILSKKEIFLYKKYHTNFKIIFTPKGFALKKKGVLNLNSFKTEKDVIAYQKLINKINKNEKF